MIDTVQIMEDLHTILLCNANLLTVNSVRYDKLAIQGQIDWSLVWLTKRNNCLGAGIIVELPRAKAQNNSVAGPVLNWEFPFLIVENPTFNRGTGGTNLKYDIIAQNVMDDLHNYADEGLGTFQVTGQPMEPSAEFEGCLCYRVTLELPKVRNVQTLRTGQVQVTTGAGTISFACAADPAADIFYTVDGSFPASANGGNPGSMKYAGSPVNVSSGQIIRARAYASGKLGSATTNTKIP